MKFVVRTSGYQGEDVEVKLAEATKSKIRKVLYFLVLPGLAIGSIAYSQNQDAKNNETPTDPEE